MEVDVVVLWVDGNDPEWLQEKRKYDPPKKDDSNSENRFRDNGLMKYWFRSIERNIPWIRTIHFVTWGHKPSFLRTNHPKLHIVKHTDYMPTGSLPTYNACALEMNLHRIKELSEHFIFFNDDMFVLKPMMEESFFSREGLPCNQYTEIPTMFKGNVEVWQMLAANDVGIVNKYFNKRASQKGHLSKYINTKYNLHDNVRSLALKILFPEIFTGFKNFHAPAPYLKDTFRQIWDKEEAVLTDTTNHRFRDLRDVNQWLALWWQIASGNFCPRRMNTATLSADDNTVDSVCNVISSQKYDMICINDPPKVSDFEYVAHKLQNAFEVLFPNKSSFEI